MSASDYLAGLSERGLRAAAKLQETIVESARGAGLDGHAHYFESSEEKLKDITKNLDSKHDSEKLDGLHRLAAMMSKGRNVSEYFPSVVKNVASTNVQVRKLVYIYLLRYAEQEPDLALLSVNTFQKDLTDPSPLIRAMALRVMSGIRVPVICPIVLLGIKKLAVDPSPYVRRTAARAVAKCYSLDPNMKESLVEIVTDMLRDRSTLTIGSVVTAFNEVCPRETSLIHPHFRKLCRMLVDADEWGQIALLNLLQTYAREQFLDPNRKLSNKERSGEAVLPNKPAALDPDHELFLSCCAPLLQSRNSAVVMSVASVYYHLAPHNPAPGSAFSLKKMANALVRLLRTHLGIEYVVLTNIATICQTHASVFSPHIRRFFVKLSDPCYIRALKLEILTSIASEKNINMLIEELQEYVKSPIQDLSSLAVRCIGRVARLLPEESESCINGLIDLMWSSKGIIASESLYSVCSLLAVLPQTPKTASTINHLIHLLHAPETGLAFSSTDDTKRDSGDGDDDEEEFEVEAPEVLESKARAKASLLSLIGLNLNLLEKFAPDVLRKAAIAFKAEAVTTKLQIVSLAAKLAVEQPDQPQVQLLARYVFNMARYDLVYDVRDRTRFLKALTFPKKAEEEETSANGRGGADEVLIGNPSHPTEGADVWAPPANDLLLKDNARKIILPTRPIPVLKNPSAGRTDYTVGSLSATLNAVMPGFEALADWPTVQPDTSVRFSNEDRTPDPSMQPTSLSSSDRFSSKEGNASSSPGRFAEQRPYFSSAAGSNGNGGGVASSSKTFNENLDDFYGAETEEEYDDDDDDEDSSEEEDDSEDEESDEESDEEEDDDDGEGSEEEIGEVGNGSEAETEEGGRNKIATGRLNR